MTQIRVSFYVLHAESETLTMDGDPDDIGYSEVFDALQAMMPFDEIERDSLDWEVLPDDDD